MVKHLSIILLLPFLISCASNKPPIEIVSKVPEPVFIERPVLEVINIPVGSDAGTVLSLHREAIKILQAYAKELEAALEVYRKPKDSK